MTPMPAVLHLLAHPGLAASRVKAALWAAGQGFAGVTQAGLCAQYPRCDIDIAAAPEAADLPLSCHPAAIGASAGVTPYGAGGATGDRRSWSGLRSRSPVAVRLAA
jgi:hypothetical protein